MIEALRERQQSRGEEIANSVSHGVALLAALIAAPILIVYSIGDGPARIVGASVFSATMVCLYLTSTLYHAFPEGKTKRIFQVLDHNAIYLMIAGTYTPFTLGVLSGTKGWVKKRIAGSTYVDIREVVSVTGNGDRDASAQIGTLEKSFGPDSLRRKNWETSSLGMMSYHDHRNVVHNEPFLTEGC